MRLVSIPSWQVACIIPMLANCVMLLDVTSVEQNETLMVSLYCMVEDSGIDSEVSMEPLMERGGWSNLLIFVRMLGKARIFWQFIVFGVVATVSLWVED